MQNMKKLVTAAVLVVAMVLALPGVASAQAAAPNCPPGQPPGRPPGTPPGNPPVPTGRPNYPPGRCQLALSQSSAARGDTFTATGGGFVPGESVALSIGSIPVSTVVADANGAFSVQLTVPRDAPIGRTDVQASAPSQTLTAGFEVVAAGAEASRGARATAAASTRSGLLARTGAAIATLTAAGTLLAALGGLLVVATRRRRALTA
jgi:hypothetical protein